MQADGNAVSYDGKYVASWATGTNGNSGAYLKLQTDGNLVTSFIPFKAQNKINHELIKYGLLPNGSHTGGGGGGVTILLKVTRYFKGCQNLSNAFLKAL